MPDPSNQFLELVIVSPDETLFEGNVTRLMAPGILQEIAILPDHTPLYAELVKGDIVATLQNGSTQEFPITSGILRVKTNKITIATGFITAS